MCMEERQGRREDRGRGRMNVSDKANMVKYEHLGNLTKMYVGK